MSCSQYISTSQPYWMNDIRIYPVLWRSRMKNSMPLTWKTKYHRNLLLDHTYREGSSDFSTFSNNIWIKCNLPLEQEVLVSTGAAGIFIFHYTLTLISYIHRAKNCVLCGWLQSMRQVLKSSASKNLPLSLRDSLIFWQRCSKPSSISCLTMEYAVSLKVQALCLRRWSEILQPELSIFYQSMKLFILVT